MQPYDIVTIQLFVAVAKTGSIAGVRTLAGYADTSHNGRVRFVIAYKSNEGAMRFKLLKALQHAGLVRSVRGARGGYQLARPAAAINAAEIIDAVEGPVALTECAGGTGNCGLESTCLVGHGWQRISHAIRGALAGVSLEELVRREAPYALPEFAFVAAPARMPVRG